MGTVRFVALMSTSAQRLARGRNRHRDAWQDVSRELVVGAGKEETRSGSTPKAGHARADQKRENGSPDPASCEPLSGEHLKFRCPIGIIWVFCPCV